MALVAGPPTGWTRETGAAAPLPPPPTKLTLGLPVYPLPPVGSVMPLTTSGMAESVNRVLAPTTL